MHKNKFRTLLLGGLSMLALSACGATPKGAQERTSRLDSVLERAAQNAASRGEDESSLALLERVYKRNSDDPRAATKYAASLRQFDYLNRASMVLRPFANDPNATPAVKNEYAAIQLAQGNYAIAEEFAQQSIIADSDNFEAFHYLGIALDAQGMHTEAERAFRKGLDYWEGDPAPIMNNLALNLATQGHVEEAKTILEKALSVAPGRVELQRNLRIISTLQEANRPTRNPAARKVIPKSKPEMDG